MWMWIQRGRLHRCYSRPPQPRLPGGEVNLHLGCGEVNHPKFVNVDALPFPHVHYLQPVDRLPNFGDGSVNLVYASHCLEHFPHEETPRVLNEWFRVLKPGGILRLSVPDFDLLHDIYRDNDNEITFIIGPIMGSQDHKFNVHYTMFNRKSLERDLRRAGFREVREWEPGSSELTTFDDWSCRKVTTDGERWYALSLNLEAVK